MNKPTRYFSSRQEKQVAKQVGGKIVPNSGAIKFGAGDVVTDDWLIECKTKTSESKSMTIQKEWLDKNEEEILREFNITEPLTEEEKNKIREENKWIEENI